MPSGSEGMGSGYARGRVAVRPGLPNGRERTKSVRSMPSGSEGMGSGYARGRVAVQLTLPLAGERTTRRVQGRVAVQTVRSGPSGSAIGTLGADWQCDSHCQSMVNVPRIAFRAEWQCNRYDRCQVAVKGWGLGTLGAEWQCNSHCQSMVNVPRVAFKVEWQCGLANQAVQTSEKPLQPLESRHRRSPVTP